MRIRVKLFALLDKYLPAGARRNEADMEVAGDATVGGILKQLKMPGEVCHLVLVNGISFIPASATTISFPKATISPSGRQWRGAGERRTRRGAGRSRPSSKRKWR